MIGFPEISKTNPFAAEYRRLQRSVYDPVNLTIPQQDIRNAILSFENGTMSEVVSEGLIRRAKHMQKRCAERYSTGR